MTSNEPTRLTDLLRRDVILEAPVFQRKFSWSDKQLTDFWEDFDAVLEPGADDATLFMGAIILRHEAASTANSAERWLIIDGQQRLTTLSLAILAICLEALESKDGARDSDTDTFVSDQIKRYLLPLSSGNLKNLDTKVMVTTPDLDDYRRTLALANIPEVRPLKSGRRSEGSRVARALLFHRDQVRQRILAGAPLPEYEKLMTQLVEKVELVEIHLSDRHDPNEVFNRLNTKGQDLTLGDLVRNEAFSRFSSNRDAANRAYQSYWRPFEEKFSTDKSRESYYWPFTLARMPTATKGKAFAMLRARWEDNTSDNDLAMKNIVDDLGSLVDEFKLVHEAVGLKKLNSSVRNAALRLHRMSLPTVTYCFVLLVLESAQNGELSPAEASESLAITESFLVRRALIGLEPTGLHAVFKRMWGATKGKPDKVRKELDRATIYFPSDQEVQSKLPNVNMYKRRLCRFIVGEYEREIMKGDPLSEEQLTNFTIDHVAPQSFTAQWAKKYHLPADEVDRLLNSWGNLVPLSDVANSSKGASTWQDASKKLRLETIYSSTKRLMDMQKDWTPSDIEERTRELTDFATRRWPDPAARSAKK